MNNITEKELSASARHSLKSHQHGKTSKSNQKKFHQNGNYQEKLKEEFN